MIKKGNKKGFTLLEVMLSVAILVIVSSMLMVGFLTSMTYAYNTSLYAKIGSSNYSNAMNTLVGLTTSPSARSATHENHLVTVNTVDRSTTPVVINYFSGAKINTESLRITDAGTTGINTSGFNAGAASSSVRANADYAEQNGSSFTYSASSTYADNRSVFFYYIPYECPVCAAAGNPSNLIHARFSTSDPYSYWCQNSHGSIGAGVVHHDNYVQAVAC